MSGIGKQRVGALTRAGILLMAAGLVGCASAPADSRHSAAGPEPIHPAVSNQSEQVRSAENHVVFQHAWSGMVFPALVGDLVTHEIHEHDVDGRNVSVHYRPVASDVALRAAVILHPLNARLGGASGHFERAKKLITKPGTRSRLIDEGGIELSQDGERHQGYRAQFVVERPDANGQSTVSQVSHLFVFEHDAWVIAYRATFAASQQAIADAQVRRFMQQLRWPNIVPGRIAGL